MGQGSSSSPATNFTTVKSRPRTASTGSSTVAAAGANNNAFINSNPDPEFSNNNTTNGNEDVKSNMKNKSYMSYRRSTASLSKIFTRKKWKKRRGSISASFNMNDSDIRVELINVNTASEEELMTLHGVNRQLARNIVNHRELIGGFRKIEDVALVSGMGASKLTQIRPEICISRRRPGLSLASSKAPSTESIPSTTGTELINIRPGSNLSRTMKLININQATIFDLMTVDGINQATAARIIEYRDRKGPFRCVDDLRRVGLHRRFLSGIKSNLTTEETESDKSSTISSTPTRPPRHIHKGKSNGHLTVTSNTIQPVSGAMIQLEDEIKSVYDLLSLKTKRPHPPQLFNYYYKSCPAYRVASWNMEAMTVDKIRNPGVMEVVTRTILENRFSVLAVQEICDKTVLEKICKELNEPTLRLNSEWTGYRGNWCFKLHPSPMHLNNNDYFLGVLYDSLRIDSVDLPKGSEFGPIQNGSLWQYAVFQIHSYSTTWVLVNVLSIPLETGNNSSSTGQTDFDQKEITDSVKSLVSKTDGAMIVGYFNAQQAQKGLSNMTDLDMILPNENSSTKSQPCTLWATQGLKQYLTDDHGVVEDGLSHLAIPNGWSMGGNVSKFGPLWCTMCASLESKTLIEENDGENDEISEEKEEISDDSFEPVR